MFWVIDSAKTEHSASHMFFSVMEIILWSWVWRLMLWWEESSGLSSQERDIDVFCMRERGWFKYSVISKCDYLSNTTSSLIIGTLINISGSSLTLMYMLGLCFLLVIWLNWNCVIRFICLVVRSNVCHYWAGSFNC